MVVIYHQVLRTGTEKKGMRGRGIDEESFHNMSQIYLHTLCNNSFSIFGFTFIWQVDGVATNLAKRNELISHLFTLLEQKRTFT